MIVREEKIRQSCQLIKQFFPLEFLHHTFRMKVLFEGKAVLKKILNCKEKEKGLATGEEKQQPRR